MKKNNYVWYGLFPVLKNISCLKVHATQFLYMVLFLLTIFPFFIPSINFQFAFFIPLG